MHFRCLFHTEAIKHGLIIALPCHKVYTVYFFLYGINA